MIFPAKNLHIRDNIDVLSVKPAPGVFLSVCFEIFQCNPLHNDTQEIALMYLWDKKYCILFKIVFKWVSNWDYERRQHWVSQWIVVCWVLSHYLIQLWPLSVTPWCPCIGVFSFHTRLHIVANWPYLNSPLSEMSSQPHVYDFSSAGIYCQVVVK